MLSEEGGRYRASSKYESLPEPTIGLSFFALTSRPPGRVDSTSSCGA